jgi:hypothetical protein
MTRLRVVLVLALAAATTAFVLALVAVSGYLDEANEPRLIRLTADQVVITRGEDWAFVASHPGDVCTSILFAEEGGGGSCVQIVGASRKPRGRQHTVAGGASYRGLSEDDLWISGVAADNVRRVEVELTDGRRLQTRLYDAPAALALDVKCFLVRTRFRIRKRWDSGSGFEVPELPFLAFNAYDADGRLLERLGPETAP